MDDCNKSLIPESIRRIADDADRKLAWQFFFMFSRFEYALKRQKYVRDDRKDAQAAWKRFANDYAKSFAIDDDPQLQRAISYIKESPPKKQIHENRELGWAEPRLYASGPLLPWLLDQIQIVRNNLFHGGKFPHTAVSDPSRDRQLIASALIVLGHVLKLNHEIENRFYEGIDL